MSNLKHILYTAVHENEELFNFIQDSAINGFWLVELAAPEKIYLNPKLYCTLGFSFESIKSDSISPLDILNAKEFDKVLNTFKSKDFASQLKISYKHHSDNSIEFNCNAIAIKNLDAEITHVLVGHMDCSSGSKKILDYQEHVQRYEHIIEGTNIGTWEWNIQSGETIFNENWAKILGYTLEELQPISEKTWEELAHPEDHQTSIELLDNHFKGNTDYFKIESRFKHKNGNWIWVKDSGKVVSWTPDGKPEWMTGSHYDITEQKEHGILLERYQDLLERSNETASIGYWEVDLDKNEVFWSKVTKKIHEVPEDYELLFDEAVNFFPLGKHRDVILNSFKEAVENGKNYDIELEIITANGKLKWVRAIGISDFKNGKCNRIYGLFQDIHIRKEAERINRERQTLLETILDTIDVGIISCDREGNLSLFNKATIDWHGIPIETIGKKESTDYYELYKIDGETPLSIEELPLLQAMYTGEVTDGEFIIKPKVGENRRIVAKGSQLVGEDGNVFGAVVSMQDITIIKKTEEQLRISEAAFRGNFENAAIGMAILNERCDWLEVNDQLSAILGYSKKELLQLSIFQVTHKDDLTADITLMKEFINGEKSVLNKESRFLHKDGHVVYVILSVSVVKNDDGKPLYFISQITDITPRKIAAQKLQETLAKLEAILDSVLS